MIRIYDMASMVKIYEKDMGVIIVKYYDTMAQAALNSAFHSRRRGNIKVITRRYKGDR